MELKAAIFDVDGVLTDGKLYYSADGESLKAFDVHDGMGLNMLAKAGLAIGVISGRSSPPLVKRLEDLNITHSYLGCKDKIAALNDLTAKLDCSLDQMVFMGDDLIDYAAMQAVGLALAPANAVADVKEIADHITQASGGAGAVREAAEYILYKLDKKPLDLVGHVFGQ